VKSGCSESHTMFASSDSNSLTCRRVEKSENKMKCVWNELKPCGVFIGRGRKFEIFRKNQIF
jgi:hypothetical protein